MLEDRHEVTILVMLPNNVPMTNVLVASSIPASVQFVSTDGQIGMETESVDITHMAAIGMATKATK